MSSDIKRIEQKPLSDADLRTILGASLKILKYSELANVSALSSLLPSGQDYCIILYEREENSGHWVALLRGSSESYGYEFFDPYGNNVDVPLKWTDKLLGLHLFLIYGVPQVGSDDVRQAARPPPCRLIGWAPTTSARRAGE